LSLLYRGAAKSLARPGRKQATATEDFSFIYPICSRWCHWIFQWHIPLDLSMALGSTQPLVKMSTRNIPGGKGGRCVRLTTSPPSCAECYEIWKPKPPGTLWATPGLLRDSFTFYILFIIIIGGILLLYICITRLASNEIF
jgi:hypothetical protein